MAHFSKVSNAGYPLELRKPCWLCHSTRERSGDAIKIGHCLRVKLLEALEVEIPELRKSVGEQSGAECRSGPRRCFGYSKQTKLGHNAEAVQIGHA